MQYENTWFKISSEIQIDIMDYLNETTGHPYRKNAVFWVFVILEKGERTLILDGKEIHLKPREFLLMPPNTLQEPLHRDEHIALYAHFRAQGEQIAVPEKLNTNQLVLPMRGSLPTDFDCTAFMKYIVKQYKRPYVSRAFCAMQLQSMLHMISLYSQKHKIWQPNEASLRENMLKFIQSNAHRTLNSQDYENEFGLSYHQLSIIFKKHIGCTIKQYHQHERMQRAYTYLLDGASIQHVARECGYDDYYFFIKCFKKEFGVSPGKFQKDNGVKEVMKHAES